MNPKRTTPNHIKIKIANGKDKERILKAVSKRGSHIRLSANFSTETLQDRRDWHEIFQVMKSKELQPRLLYPARLSFKN